MRQVMDGLGDSSFSMGPVSHAAVRNSLCLILYTVINRDTSEEQGLSTR